MTAWTALDVGKLLPSELTSAVEALASLLSTELAAAKAAIALTDGVPEFPSLPDASTAVIKAVLDTLTDLLKGGRVHTLIVPIAKAPPHPRVPPLPPTLDALQAGLDVKLGPTTPAEHDAYAELVAASGGNAGFYRAFAESIADLSDPNRPQYESSTDAVAMATLLVGAPSYAQIVAAASTIEMLVRPRGATSSPTARTIPTPQNVRAKVVGAVGGNGVGVRIEWTAPADAIQNLYFPGVVVAVNRYAIIRSTNPKAASARSVLDLFSTQALTEGRTENGSTVVAIGSGRNSAYLDTNADPAATTYYMVAWECVVREHGVATTLPFDRVSSVVKVSARTPAPAQTGRAPNWTATPSAVDMFPSVAAAARRVIEEARVLTAPKTTPKARIAQTISLAESAAQRASQRATDLMGDLKRLSTALGRPNVGVYVTQMHSARGGNAFLLAELAKRLGDVTDPTRPPFDNGEYVCGVCFVAGASRLADIAAAIAFFESLFGAAAPSNPLLGVLGAIDTIVTQAEATTFDPGMHPRPPTTIDPTTGLPTSTTAPVDPITGLPLRAATPVVANNGTAVSTNDPSNPNAGDTNVTPIENLC